MLELGAALMCGIWAGLEGVSECYDTSTLVIGDKLRDGASPQEPLMANVTGTPVPSPMFSTGQVRTFDHWSTGEKLGEAGFEIALRRAILLPNKSGRGRCKPLRNLRSLEPAHGALLIS